MYKIDVLHLAKVSEYVGREVLKAPLGTLLRVSKAPVNDTVSPDWLLMRTDLDAYPLISLNTGQLWANIVQLDSYTFKVMEDVKGVVISDQKDPLNITTY